MSSKNSKAKHLAGLSYAFTDNGIELPVLDITHPLFISSIDETALEALGKEALKKTGKFKKMPDFYKKFLGKRSFILGGILLNKMDDPYLNGMSTLMIKLGPGLIDGGGKRFLDRAVSKGFNAVAMRMRVRDISHIQAEALMPLLRKSPGKNPCFINIAGGAASDSINTLISIQEKEPALLNNRQIEINVLDIDTFGPNFAERCIKSLMEPGARFHGLDISFKHIQYNWNNAAALTALLSERKEWIQVCASEGGLFEYGSDEEIVQNLESLYKHSADDMIIAGDVMLGIDKINPALPAMSELTGLKTRFIGIGGLKKILEKTKWQTHRIVEGRNPTYTVFTLKKHNTSST